MLLGSVLTQQRFGVMDIKALWSWTDCVYSSQTNQCYSSILFRKQQENTSLKREGMLTQRREEKRVGESSSARERERQSTLWLLFLYVFFLPLGLPYVNWTGVFVLLEVLTLVLGPSFVLFLWAFPFLVFQPPPFWTPFPYSTYLAFPPQEMGGPILWEQGRQGLSGYFLAELGWREVLGLPLLLASSLRVLIAVSIEGCVIFSAVGCSFISLLKWHCMLQLVDLGRDRTGQTIDSTWNNHKHHQYSTTRTSRGSSQF